MFFPLQSFQMFSKHCQLQRFDCCIHGSGPSQPLVFVRCVCLSLELQLPRDLLLLPPPSVLLHFFVECHNKSPTFGCNISNISRNCFADTIFCRGNQEDSVGAVEERPRPRAQDHRPKRRGKVRKLSWETRPLRQNRCDG